MARLLRPQCVFLLNLLQVKLPVDSQHILRVSIPQNHVFPEAVLGVHTRRGIIGASSVSIACIPIKLEPFGRAHKTPGSQTPVSPAGSKETQSKKIGSVLEVGLYGK